MKKFLSYVCLTLLALVIIDVLYGFAMEKLSGNRYVSSIDHIREAHEDIAIIGSSRANHHYDPQLLSDSLNLTAYNYGIEGLNILADKAVLSMLINQSEKKPQMVILDLSESDICDVQGWNTEHLSLLYPYADVSAVDSLFADVIDPREYFFVRYSKLYRHNSNILDYLKPKRAKGQRHENGFTPLEGTWSGEPLEPTTGYDVSPQKLDYLERCIKLCADNDVLLVLSTSPNYNRLPKERNWIRAIEKVAHEHHLTYLYHEQDAEFLSHPDWFNEPYHLNAEGAEIFTRKIIPELPCSHQD
ncbi:MAG: hypothetical protein IJ887_08885 [Prevotella sp.]|nr:hypothetical protein [Prevotella sp.]MBR3479101.1 hypothetical protein [Prevotella sp.]MBR6189572.1 hypothetical protein [Prevotella sp.]